jgi:D-glycero-D-manno-heptose 1,7-bisphosphate phosphatase
MKARRALFIDRDGTLILEKHYLHKVAEVEFIPGAVSALQKAVHAGFVIVMVTNQSGVGRGYFTLSDVEAVHSHLVGELARHSISFVKIYVAPEAPDSPSRGRKPSPQFLFDARDEFDIDLSQSFMIGDKIADLQAGWYAGVRASILVRTGHGLATERDHPVEVKKAIVVDTLREAIDWVLRLNTASEAHPEPE